MVFINNICLNNYDKWLKFVAVINILNNVLTHGKLLFYSVLYIAFYVLAVSFFYVKQLLQ